MKREKKESYTGDREMTSDGGRKPRVWYIGNQVKKVYQKGGSDQLCQVLLIGQVLLIDQVKNEDQKLTVGFREVTGDCGNQQQWE